MIFTVSQISPSVELVFSNTEDIINVYPSYHQKGGLMYANVDRSAWYVVGGQYRWETSFDDITADTVPVIQLIYSYNITEGERKQQYDAFTSITAVETVAGKLYLYTNSRPYSSFRIRYRILNKMDLAIPLNRMYSVGIGYQSEYGNVIAQTTAVNPVTGESAVLSTQIPSVALGQTGMMPGYVLARLVRLERARDASLEKLFYVYQQYGVGPDTTTWYDTASQFLSIAAHTYSGLIHVGCASSAAAFLTDLSNFLNEQDVTTIDVAGLFTELTENFSYAFYNNADLLHIKNLDLLDTHLATDMSYMFAENPQLQQLDLRTWYVDRVLNVEGMFKNCTSLTYLNVSSFDFTRQLEDGTMLIDQPDIFTGVPNNCALWVGGQEQASVILSRYPNFEDIYTN